MTAKEPYNYFLLLRALFRYIGGGSHDLLYQEFLPLFAQFTRRFELTPKWFSQATYKTLLVRRTVFDV